MVIGALPATTSPSIFLFCSSLQSSQGGRRGCFFLNVLYWHILRSDSVSPVVSNQLPLGSERLEWVSSPLPKDVKTSALRESAGWSRMSQSFCVRNSRCMASGQGLRHPSSILSFLSCLLMMLVEQLL